MSAHPSRCVKSHIAAVCTCALESYVTMTEGNPRPSQLDLLNYAAFAVAKLGVAKRGSGASSQVNQLLEVFSRGKGKDAILLVQEHLVYQSGQREVLPREFSKQVYEDLADLYKLDTADATALARMYLTHLKRLYKGAEKLRPEDMRRISNREDAFDQLARLVFGDSRGQDRRPRKGPR